MVKSGRRALTWLVAVTGGVWLCVALPATYNKGDGPLLCSGIAALLCLLPAAVTLWWGVALKSDGQPRAPEEQLVFVAGATGVRLVVVFGVGALLATQAPMISEHRRTFLTWGLIFYLTTLIVETVLLTAGMTRTDAQPSEPHG